MLHHIQIIILVPICNYQNTIHGFESQNSLMRQLVFSHRCVFYETGDHKEREINLGWSGLNLVIGDTGPRTLARNWKPQVQRASQQTWVCLIPWEHWYQQGRLRTGGWAETAGICRPTPIRALWRQGEVWSLFYGNSLFPPLSFLDSVVSQWPRFPLVTPKHLHVVNVQ